MTTLEHHFSRFREGIVGIDQTFTTPDGEKRIVYADWIASGRLYRPIEQTMCERFGPFVGNTHSEASVTGTTMTHAYHRAREVIKKHVNAADSDCLVMCGAGMTGAINKLQRILGLRVPEQFADLVHLADADRPVVFVTHMEHHSNQTTWLETIADVVVIPSDDQGLVCCVQFEKTLQNYLDRPNKIGAFSACSNVTGIRVPYYELSKIIHRYGGISVVDFAASAPYDDINMHPSDPEACLDAIVFSPHKFLGGPGSSGVLVFADHLYKLKVPDQPGGGTVNWTNPWGDRSYFQNIEAREDGGTPAFLQTIRASLAIRLKEELDVQKIRSREEILVNKVMDELEKIPGLHILAGEHRDRIGAISFYVDGMHYNLIVKLLNDKFGVQVRGGCSCAGTYGHFLLHVDRQHSKSITDKIDRGDLSEKPGWVRLSLHPVMTDEEVDFTIDAIKKVVAHAKDWERSYEYHPEVNEYFCRAGEAVQPVEDWFEVS